VFQKVVDNVARPFQALASKLGLRQEGVNAAAVNLGPLSIPTTGSEWQDSWTGLQQRVRHPLSGAQVVSDDEPRLVREFRRGWRSIRPKFLGAQAAVEHPKFRLAVWILLGLVAALAVAGVVNRMSLNKQLKKLRADIKGRP
jgi:hypothetical protein